METQLKQIHFGTQRVITIPDNPTSLLLIVLVTMTVLYVNGLINDLNGLYYRDALACVLNYWSFLIGAIMLDNMGKCALRLHLAGEQ